MSHRKTYGVWKAFPTFQRLHRCFKKAARAKYDRESVIQFHANLEPNLIGIRESLAQERYIWGGYRSFWVEEPKLRLIESAPFQDRIVHHAIHEILEPIFDPSFYDHSYACRRQKGTHRSMKQLHTWIRAKPELHYLQMDVSQFFPTIDREILFQRILKKIGDETFLKLIRSLLDSAPKKVGIPIGNLTSQLFANIYLNPMDQFIKRELKIPYYVRYMDDFILLHPDRKHLQRMRAILDEYARDELHLKFHPYKVVLERVSQGIGFVGYRVYPNRIDIKGKSLRRFRTKLNQARDLDQRTKRFLSYQGHLAHASRADALIESFKKIAFQEEGFVVR